MSMAKVRRGIRNASAAKVESINAAPLTIRLNDNCLLHMLFSYLSFDDDLNTVAMCNHQVSRASAARVSLLIRDDLTPSFAETHFHNHISSWHNL